MFSSRARDAPGKPALNHAQPRYFFAAPADRWVAGPPWAASGYPAQLAPHYVRRQPRRPARHHPGPIAFLPFAVLMLIGTSAAFLIPVVIVALVGLAHVVPRAQRRG